MNKSFINQVFYKSSQKMTEIPDFSVDLIITSPPYFNIKDYSKDGLMIMYLQSGTMSRFRF